MNKEDLFSVDIKLLSIHPNFHFQLGETFGYLRCAGCSIFMDKTNSLVIICPFKQVKNQRVIRVCVIQDVIKITSFLNKESNSSARSIEQEFAFGFDYEAIGFRIRW